jgi:hypothetical protein
VHDRVLHTANQHLPVRDRFDKFLELCISSRGFEAQNHIDGRASRNTSKLELISA